MQDSVALMVAGEPSDEITMWPSAARPGCAEKLSQYPRKKRIPGAKVKIHIHPSFFDPMSKQELAESGME
jgi:hypothetical protein